MLTPLVALSAAAMIFAQPRLVERRLADVAVIRVPRAANENYKDGDDRQPGRIVFTFADSYFWGSFGSGTAYKQQLFVSVMAPDATDEEYHAWPDRYSLRYDKRTTVRKQTVGSGTLTVTEGRYQQNALNEPSHTFEYIDRARRLQLVWHAAKKEVDLEDGIEAVGRMAASFRIVKDPVAQFAEIRDRPRKEAEEAARKVAVAREMLVREGYGPLEPGKPVLENDVYVEWMADPEPRFQLVVPLGQVRSSANARPIERPRPVRLTRPDGKPMELVGTVGWREFTDGKWELSNDENDYVPMDGIAEVLAAKQTERDMVYFYYSATVRVKYESDDTRINDVRWFLNSVPEVRRLWREGKLVKGGAPE
jgi:hypothetical protein